MDRAELERAITEQRSGLLAHCYRMMGSASDAEDALQNALVKAWRHLDTFEERSTLRTWLYRIATRSCLDLLVARRARTLPELAGPPGQPESNDAGLDAAWLEPFPDLPDVSDERAPDAVYASREAVRLAFVVALQVLPPRQRAVLLLRDVVGLSAEQTAEELEMSVAAANSALQRARATLEEQPRVRSPSLGEQVRDLLRRYVAAWEAGDSGALIQLLRSDAILSMPPLPLWVQGPQAIAALLDAAVFAQGAVQLVACRANGAPAFGVVRGETVLGLSVLDIEGDQIAMIHSFLPGATPLDLGPFIER